MKLERLHLRNFRCFEEFTMDFDPRLTVIVAENGAGKTAILDAIALGFGRYLTKLPGVNGRTTKDTDIRIDANEKKAAFMMLGWEAKTREGELVVWSGGRRRDSSINAAAIRKSLPEKYQALFNKGVKQIDAIAAQLLNADAEGAPYFLPVIAYYGTNRAIRDEVQRRRGFKKQFLRFEALAGALEPDSRFRAAFEWFNAMEDMERRGKEAQRDFDFRLPELEQVRSAILRMLPPGFSNPRTEIRPLRFVIDQRSPDGVVRTLRLSQLSDGYRVVLGLVMDLARRMAQANSAMAPLGAQVMNPLDLPAIAIIDEVDLHLHPEWQQRVLTDLRQTFRNTQFIITTHSPQVLSTVPAKSIRMLQRRWNETSNKVELVGVVPDQQTEGIGSMDILASVMGTDPTPNLKASQQVSSYRALIQQDLADSEVGRELREELEGHFGASHPVIQECDRLIRLQNLKRLMSKAK